MDCDRGTISVHACAFARLKYRGARDFTPLQTEHGINDLMKQLVGALIRDQPLHPLQYMIDLLQEGAAGATQDKFGLNKHRRERIITIFEAVDKVRLPSAPVSRRIGASY